MQLHEVGMIDESMAQLGSEPCKQVFSEVIAVISDHLIQMLSATSPTYIELLHSEANICYADKENMLNGRIIKGTLPQIIQAQHCLMKYLCGLHGPEKVNDENCSTRIYTSDKAVTCDLIRPSHLTEFAKKHPRQARRSSWMFRQRPLATHSGVKVKYRAHARRVLNNRRKIIVQTSAGKNLQTNVTVTNVEIPLEDMDKCNSRLQMKDCNTNGMDDLMILTQDAVVGLEQEENECRSTADILQDENQEPKVCSSRSEIRPNYEQLKPFKFFCKNCSYKSKRESHYIRHLALHDKVKTLYNCDQCSFSTIRLSHLRRHAISHSQTTFDCELCPYKTDVVKLLHRHVKLKHNGKEEEERIPAQIFECTQCSYKTSLSHNYKRHLKVHVPPDGTRVKRIYFCDQCDYKTNRKEHYRRHVSNVHGDNRPYLCDFCGKAFKRHDALKQHHMTHVSASSRIVQFKCGVCQKNCRSQHQLNEHQAVHTNVRAFLCEICGASFKTRSVHRKHILNIHKNPRAHSCEHCLKRFNTNFALRRHLRLHEANDDDDDSRALLQLEVADASLLMNASVTNDESFIQTSMSSKSLADGHPAPDELARLLTVTSATTARQVETVMDSLNNATLVTIQEPFELQSSDFMQQEQENTALLYLTTTYS